MDALILIAWFAAITINAVAATVNLCRGLPGLSGISLGVAIYCAAMLARA